MYIPDLAFYDEQRNIKAISWLDAIHPFAKGGVSQDFLHALRIHLQNPWQLAWSFGVHFCELCLKQDKNKHVSCTTMIWIPGPSKLYLAPTMILHYIETHSYCPPKVFMDAVLACPPQGSAEFLARVFTYYPDVEIHF